jgi:hypothetical protein
MKLYNQNNEVAPSDTQKSIEFDAESRDLVSAFRPTAWGSVVLPLLYNELRSLHPGEMHPIARHAA